MANQQQLALLKQGVEGWNFWREDNPGEKIDLCNAFLRGADLRDADLSTANLSNAILINAKLSSTNLSDAILINADLSSANLTDAILINAKLSGISLSKANLLRAYLHSTDLSSADLRKADLHSSNLRSSNLHSADLSGADLSKADLSSADLRSSNLSGADLSVTNLSGADLGGADLNGADLFETVFANVNLSGLKGLTECLHMGPSIIDHRTLSRSGQLPESFLRGIGLPDTFIDYIPALFNQPLQFYSCFISYSHQDEEFAKRLHADLQDQGVRCWYAPEDLPIGAKIRVDIDQAIRKHDKLLLILSEHSVNSQWVESEVESALEKERQSDKTVLFPIRLDDTVMTSGDGWAGLIKRSRNIGNFCNWKDYDAYQQVFERLLRDLKPALTEQA